jgi:hypothetical protein
VLGHGCDRPRVPDVGSAESLKQDRHASGGSRPEIRQCGTHRLPPMLSAAEGTLGRCYSALGSGYSASGRCRLNGRSPTATGDSPRRRLQPRLSPYPALGLGACVQDKVRRFPVSTAYAAPPGAELAAGSPGDLDMDAEKPSALRLRQRLQVPSPGPEITGRSPPL